VVNSGQENLFFNGFAGLASGSAGVLAPIDLDPVLAKC
jgi:hypothetical protein